MARRAGLSSERIVDVAAEFADRHGLEDVTLARVAAELGVRSPSLYNHIDGLDDLHQQLRVHTLEQLKRCLQQAALGRSRDDAVRAMAAAYRRFALEHPGRYAATVRASENEDDAVWQVGHEIVATVAAALSGYGHHGDDALHAVRIVRSSLHGFVSLELSGGFALPLDLDETFDRMVDMLIAGLRDQAP